MNYIDYKSLDNSITDASRFYFNYIRLQENLASADDILSQGIPEMPLAKRLNSSELRLLSQMFYNED